MTVLSKANLSVNDQITKVIIALIISTASLYASTLNAAPIYKVVDSQTGQITFTDNPQSYDQQENKQVSQTGITTGNNSNSPNVSSANRANQTTTSQMSSSQNNNASSTLSAQSVTDLPEMTSQARVVNYQLIMLEPSAERAYRRPAQSIAVQLQMNPALQAGDTVTISLDDTVVAQGLSASIATVDILPGEHNIRAVVMNKKGQVVQQVSRKVYVIQNTVRLQQNKKIAEQLLAYERLSWTQKMLLKLRRDKGTNVQFLNTP